MKQRKRDRMTVMFGLPTYTGRLHVATMQMLMGEAQALKHMGHKVLFEDRCGGADIAAGRNAMLACFLSSDATHLFMVDDDVNCARNGILRLLSYGEDFVAAVYPKREEPIRVTLKYIEGQDGPISHPSGLIEVGGVPGGFICISRRCARKMVRAYADMEYICNMAPNGRAWAVFDPYWYEDALGRHRLSEDFSFCRRWRDIGGSVLVDPDIPMGHVGHKEYTITLRDVMETKEPDNGPSRDVSELGMERRDKTEKAVST